MFNTQIGVPVFGYAASNRTSTKSPTAAQIAAELARINPTLVSAAPRSTSYQANPFTARQLSQLSQQNGLLSAQNPQYQQYLAKMAGYGAGAGKTAPTVTAPTQGNK